MMILIFLIIGGLFIYLMVRNNQLENSNFQYELEKIEKLYYDEYKNVSTVKLKKELKELTHDYNLLLNIAKKRYEKDDNKSDYSGKTYYFVDGTPFYQHEEDIKYMSANNDEKHLYYRYNVIRDIIERRKTKDE